MPRKNQPGCPCCGPKCQFWCGPQVTIDPPPGGGKRATAWVDVRDDGTLGNLRLLSGGSGYAAAPGVSISPPPAGGTRATATATVTRLAVSGLTLTDAGAGYTVDNTPPAAFDLTISSPAVTVGPIRLARGAIPPTFAVVFTGSVPANGIDGCTWYGQVTATFPAGAYCPAVTCDVGAAAYFSVDGWVVAVAYKIAPGGAYAIACPAPPPFVVLCECPQAAPDWYAAEPLTTLPIGGCTGRPFSETWAGAPWPWPCDFGCVDQHIYALYGGTPPDPLFIVYTMTEVPPS